MTESLKLGAAVQIGQVVYIVTGWEITKTLSGESVKVFCTESLTLQSHQDAERVRKDLIETSSRVMKKAEAEE